MTMRRKKVTPETIQEALKELGDSDAAVARSLRRLRIKGNLCSPQYCPITRYLQRHFKCKDVRTGCFGTTVGNVAATLTNAVSLFVINFDDKHHPSLIAKE